MSERLVGRLSMVVLLAIMAGGWSTNEADGGFPEPPVIVGAADTLCNSDSAGSASFSIPHGKRFYAIASTGAGTDGLTSRVFIKGRAAADTAELLIPVGGGDTDYVDRGIYFIEVRSVASGDSLIVKVRG